jgi:hypothetical protein
MLKDQFPVPVYWNAATTSGDFTTLAGLSCNEERVKAQKRRLRVNV